MKLELENNFIFQQEKPIDKLWIILNHKIKIRQMRNNYIIRIPKKCRSTTTMGESRLKIFEKYNEKYTKKT